ncbi:VOC family protein [Nakamurella sp. PAMC28650]|uniref:VOC family protein n=1 Tax=Nakamurella sp. PAMC28650 TaxID=2762325 RepID=UPI00164EBB10|nr:VOC family protein [Nakamurella sp. PAMC28650]QNK80108.1 VOC family protein [Nakamurella sp. PAMC28650]
MSVNAVTHLNFRGQAREALEFYRSVFGGQAMIVTYGDFGLPKELPDSDKVVFGQINADNGFRVMAYDIPSQSTSIPAALAPAAVAPAAVASAAPTRREKGMTLTSEPFFVSVRGDALKEVGALWDKLSVGATIIEAYGPAQWSPASGMLTDRFGVTWILDVAAAY